MAYARRRHGGRGDFRCEIVADRHLAELGRFDAVFLFGLLHHLDDAQCGALLDFCARALAPGGRVISCDPTLHTGQHWISRWMSEHDRGGYVRRPESYDGLARSCFGEVEARLFDTLSRVPASHYLMRMTAPVRSADSLVRAEPSPSGT